MLFTGEEIEQLAHLCTAADSDIEHARVLPVPDRFEDRSDRKPVRVLQQRGVRELRDIREPDFFVYLTRRLASQAEPKKLHHRISRIGPLETVERISHAVHVAELQSAGQEIEVAEGLAVMLEREPTEPRFGRRSAASQRDGESRGESLETFKGLVLLIGELLLQLFEERVRSRWPRGTLFDERFELFPSRPPFGRHSESLRSDPLQDREHRVAP
jgi:hypothetical protein